MTNQGNERLTREIPHLKAHLLHNLDKNGVMMLGSWVETGNILVGKLRPVNILILLYKRLFPRLEPVSSRSHDINFAIAPRIPFIHNKNI